MLKYWSHLTLSALLVLCSCTVIAADASTISIAGQQRMLSQRLVKSWCQIGLNVMPSVSRTQLDETIKRFEDNLTELETAVTSAEARNALTGLRAAWIPLRAAALNTIRQGDAAQLNSRAEDVLMAAERLTRILHDQSALPASRWVNLAGRQRMLSQRLVKIYMLRQWGVDNTALRDELERVQSEFAGALVTMQQRAENTPQQHAELVNLELQWEWLRIALATEGANSFRLVIAESGDAVLGLADQITRLYEQSPP